MKIIYITDIHGAFSRVYTLLKETIADAYLVSGDLLDMPFYSMDPAVGYITIQNFFNTMRRDLNRDDEILEDFTASLANDPETDESIKKKADIYLETSEKARNIMLKKYQILSNIFSSKHYTDILTIPGNYDMDLQGTALDSQDIHLQTRKIDSLTVAGYGGADIRTPGFPEKYSIRYRGRKNGHNDKETELYRFLEKAKPQIIMAHHPAYGIMDNISHYGSWGSPPLRTYCDNNNVLMCLTGHIHEQWGVHYTGNTLYLNPSNFGEFLTPSGEVSEGGFFFEIELNESSVSKILYKKLVKEQVHDIAEYMIQNDSVHETVIDRARMDAALLNSTYDTNIQHYTQIPELRIFRDIRNFFRIHQTEETEKRIEMLQEAVDSLGEDASSVAIDVVGSVNLGIAQESSDIDFVLYRKCGLLCKDEDETKDHCVDIEKRLREYLEPGMHFEVIDYINLDYIMNSIEAERYDCDMTQRFASYRAICRPVNYRVIAPIEDKMNQNINFRKGVEENLRSYLRMFAATSDNKKSFDKYETRLKSLGIKIPDAILKRIRVMLQTG